MLNQTTNKIQSLGFGYKKIDAIKHQLIINGASERNRTAVPALARPYTNRCTTPASNTLILYTKMKNM